MMLMMLFAALTGFAIEQASVSTAPATKAAPPPAVFVGSAEIDATMRESIANNTLDKRVGLASGPRGIVRVGIVHRTVQEPRALMHEELTEIYQIVEGSGTLLTAGVSQKVKPKDVIIVPAGTPHKFSQLDGPISYVIYRFEAPQGKKE